MLCVDLLVDKVLKKHLSTFESSFLRYRLFYYRLCTPGNLTVFFSPYRFAWHGLYFHKTGSAMTYYRAGGVL